MQFYYATFHSIVFQQGSAVYPWIATVIQGYTDSSERVTGPSTLYKSAFAGAPVTHQQPTISTTQNMQG
jgi:hypothetical protein